MKKTMRLAATYALVGLATACGSKEKPEETAETTPSTETATPATEAPAASPEAATPGAAASFDISSVPVSTANLGRFPYLGRLKGYKINVPSDSVEFEFDRSYIYDGKNLVAVEGRVLRREYVPIDDNKKTSELMMQRNYENLIKSLGGVPVASGQLPGEAVEKLGSDEYHKHDGNIDPGSEVSTYVIRQKDKEVWIQLATHGYNYFLNVTEKAAMPQQVGIIKAE